MKFFNNNPVIDRLLKGFGVNLVDQILNVVIQVVGVPLYLSSWGLQLYGEWLVLFSIPSYLILSDLGFAKASINEMTISYAKRDLNSVNILFGVGFLLTLLLNIFLLVISVLVIWFLPINDWLNLTIITSSELLYILITLILYVIINQQSALLTGVLSASEKYFKGVTIYIWYRSFEFLGTISIVFFYKSPLYLSIFLVFVSILKFINLIYIIRSREYNYITFNSLFESFDEKLIQIKRIFVPALAFMSSPIGNALRNQVPLLFIASLLGPSFVVVYSSIRTIFNIGIQFIGVVNKPISPEYALAYGKKDFDLMKFIYFKSFKLVFWICTILAFLLFLFGERILDSWTRSQVIFEPILFTTFLICLIINSLWFTSSFLLYSINMHNKQAVGFLLSCFFGTVISFFSIVYFGIDGAAIGILLSDIIMLFIVMHLNSKFLNVPLKSFFFYLIEIPFLFSFDKDKN